MLLPLHEGSTEVELGGQVVVSTAAQRHVAEMGGAAVGMSELMVEFEPPRFTATDAREST